MSFTLAIGRTCTLPKPLARGDVLKFSSDTVTLTSFGDEEQDNTSVNLLSGEDDVLLTISFRRPTETVFYNSRLHGVDWGPGEHGSFRGCFQNGPASVEVTDTTSSFDIVINGTLRHVYQKRILRPTVRVCYWKDQQVPSTMFASDLVVSISRSGPPPSTKSYEAAYFRYTATQAAEESNHLISSLLARVSVVGCSLRQFLRRIERLHLNHFRP